MLNQTHTILRLNTVTLRTGLSRTLVILGVPCSEVAGTSGVGSAFWSLWLAFKSSAFGKHHNCPDRRDKRSFFQKDFPSVQLLQLTLPAV